jgi:hypothetical protein
MAQRKPLTLVNGFFQEVNTPTDKIDLAGNTTTDLTEGTNLYYTDTRARGSLSVSTTDPSPNTGLGSLSYASGTGVFTFTQVTDANVRGLFSVTASQGIDYNSSTGVFGLSNIPNSSLTNSSITITDARGANTAVNLGDTYEIKEAQNVIELVRNETGATIPAGCPLAIVGYAASRPLVAPADADDATKMPCIGLAAEQITNNSNGAVVATGISLGYDTSSFTTGDVLYIGTTPGTLTTTKPTGESSLIQNIGKVTLSASNGRILVMGPGRSNAVSNLNNGNIFIGNASNQAVTNTLDTSIVPENTNLYYTDTRSRSAISVTDSGGDGSLSYNSGTGVITYTGPSASDARAHFSVAAGSGLTYNSGTGEFGTSAIPNAQLANSSITIGSTGIALGGTSTTIGGLTSVGIGIASPSSDLHIYSSNPQFRIQDSDGTNQFALFRQIGSGTYYEARNNTGGGAHLFRTYNGSGYTERFRINSDGNVGIGTSSPDRNLHVNSGGNTLLKVSSTFSNSTSTGIEIDTTGDSSAARLNFLKAGTTRGTIKYSHNAVGSSETLGFNVASGSDKVTITGAGNVGIGATDPLTKLHIEGTTLCDVVNYANNQDAAYLIAGTDGWTGATTNWNTFGFQHRIKSDGSGVARITVDTTDGEALCINSNKRIGIGTTSPSTLLHLDAAEPVIRLQDSDGTNQYTLLRQAGGAIYYDSRNNTAGGANIWRTWSGSTYTERMRINADGRVGIGTSSPSTTLHIVGDVTADGDVRMGDSDGSHYVGFEAPATVTTSLVWTLPAADGTSGQVLSTDGSGVLSWSSASGGVTSVTGTSPIASSGGTTPAISIQDATTAQKGAVQLTDSTSSTSTTTAATPNSVKTTYDAALKTTTTDIKSAGSLTFNDNILLYFGTGNDAELFCDGTHMYMDLNTGIGNFYIRDGSTTRFTFDDAGDFTATGNVTAYSDISLKEDIQLIPNALDKLKTLKGVTYLRNDLNDGVRHTGVIAQEVEKVLPEAVRTDENGILSVAYGNMIGILIEAIKEQDKTINELKAAIQS